MAKTSFAALFLTLIYELNLKVRVKHTESHIFDRVAAPRRNFFIVNNSQVELVNRNDIIKLRETCITHLSFYHVKVPANSTSKFDITKLFLENLESKRDFAYPNSVSTKYPITVKVRTRPLFIGPLQI